MSGYVHITPQRGWMEPARTLAFGSIVDAYSAIGTGFDHPARIDAIYNLTDEDVWISIDGVNNYFPVLLGGGGVTDRAANGIELPKGTIIYVKRFVAGAAPTLGSVVLSVSYKVQEI